MEIGVPKETKDQEFRVGLSPSSVRVLCEKGHSLFVETGAGAGAGFGDEDYIQTALKLLPAPKTLGIGNSSLKSRNRCRQSTHFFRKSSCSLPICI